jgi:hypothetical protein
MAPTPDDVRSPAESDPTATATPALGTAEPSSLPSVGARVAAFLLILLAGAAGGFIGYAFVQLQVDDDATVAMGIGALVGATIAAGGVAIVVTLTLRAMGEWKTIKARDDVAPPTVKDVRPPRVR